MLEDECKYKLSLHYRDFIPGEAIVDNIAECVHRSRKILTVVTPGFLKSEWCRFEADQGLCHAVKRPNTLIVIMLNEMAVSKLPRSLQTILNKVTYLVWDDHNLKKMREKLNRALDSPTAKSEPDITICWIDDPIETAVHLTTFFLVFKG